MKANKNQSVKVALRVRPLNKRETEMKSPLCVETQDNILEIKKGKDVKQFVFDYVFNITNKQADIYESCGYSLVENALEGYNGTIFAYGQTGAGKTFTMVGDYKDPEWKGIIPRGFDHVITGIQTSEDKRYVVRASFIEIYNEDIFDLLDQKGDIKKQLKESPQTGVFIKDLKSVPVKSVDQLFKLLDFGNKNRSVATTAMNATSSRSHALFTVHIQSLEGEKVKASKLNFVDLAGSERQGKTGATGDTLKEGAKINLSLTALGNVINALVDGKKNGHIPYRDSKLTRLLQDSLGGNTKTLMIASVSPADDNYDETISTLRYAARARNIKNTPKVNQDPKDALIKEYLGQIEKLKKQLGAGSSGSQSSETSEELIRELEKVKLKEKQLSEKEAELLQMKIKLKQMEEIVIKKEKQTPEMIEKAKKRKLQKRKIEKRQELNQNKIQQLEDQEEKDLEEDNQKQQKQQDKSHYINLCKKLKKKIKNLNSDKKDQASEFEEERQRLNECIRNLEGNLSIYKQIAQKFLSDSDIVCLKQKAVFDYEKRQCVIPPFLLHDEKLTLPKSLKQHEVDDLWREKRKGYKMEILNEPLPELKNEKSHQILKNVSQCNSMYKSYQEESSSPFIKNRRILKMINFDDEKYKQKQYTVDSPYSKQQDTIFRRTNFRVNNNSNSKEKRPTSSSRYDSKTKLAPLGPAKIEKQQEKRSVSRGKEKLQPIRK